MRLLDEVRQSLRLGHYSNRTEEAYVSWIRRFILFHDKRHPREMGATEIRAFLAHLATAERVSASTQNQALGALMYLYQRVLHFEPGEIGDHVRARTNQSLPVVLTRSEVRAVLAQLAGVPWLVACCSTAPV